MTAQAGKLLPCLAGIRRAEQRRVFHSGKDSVRIGERWLEMPDSLELPGMLRAVVPLMGSGGAVVLELVTHRLPRLAAVAGTLDHLAKPAAALRSVQPVGVNGRTLEVIKLPAREMGAANIPVLTLAIRSQDERA